MEYISAIVSLVIIYFLGRALLSFLKKISGSDSNALKKGEKLERDIFQSLESLEGHKKVMKNIYIPKSKGDTTEIDVLLIHTSGIYVFESKDYSGWIFGNEKDYKWTQVFKKQKIRFYNPIKQNMTHIKALQHNLDSFKNVKYHSVIVFGSKATLKKVTYDEMNTKIIQYDRKLPDFIIKENVLSELEVDHIHKKLLAFENVSEEIKQQHINQINSKIG